MLAARSNSAEAEPRRARRRSFNSEAIRACATLLGRDATTATHPGGKSRKSIRLHLADGGSLIATRRRDADRGKLEDRVLRALAKRGAAVPRVLAYDGTILLQEDLAGERLPLVLGRCAPQIGERWLDAALASLAGAQRAGRAAGLRRRAPAIGQTTEWIRELVDLPGRICAHLDLPPPRLPVDELIGRLTVAAPQFIKWDARPGNALARPDGAVAWFDWEHCGARDRLDDMAWLLGDEYVPDWREVEERLIARHLAEFAGDRDHDDAADYLAAFGSFHMVIRLGLIFYNKEKDPWWDAEYCLAGDKVGVTQGQALSSARRAARWASRSRLTAELSRALEAVADRIAAMD